MPTITVSLRDISSLVPGGLTQQTFDMGLRLAKAEIQDRAGDELRIELQDTNRPDLWSAEGLARQIGVYYQGKPRKYPFFLSGIQGKPEIHADPALKDRRPFVGGFLAKGPAVTNAFLVSLIQNQEKLSDNLGRKRSSLSMGVYRADAIRFPVSYKAVRAGEKTFTPLGSDRKMTLAEILAQHPKGVQYGGILAGWETVPILEDAGGTHLSFPPIINSREIGEVQVGDTHLFVEMTATELRPMQLGLNIMAANLADRGYAIEPVATVYPFDTPAGRRVTAPAPLDGGKAHEGIFPMELAERLLGVKLVPAKVVADLWAYGIEAVPEDAVIRCWIPPYRADLIHPVDLVEDYLLSRGINSLEPAMPPDFTIGKSDPLSDFTDGCRELWIGLGFEEIFSNILTSPEELREKMNLKEDRYVALANPKSATYSALRDWLLPGLLKVEAQSGKALYPHRIFEAGEVEERDADGGCRTRQRLVAMAAHPEANLSELHASLAAFLGSLGASCEVSSADHPSFLPGRFGRASIRGTEVGWIGEVHPEVLERWGIKVPCAACELSIETLRDVLKT